MNLILIKTTKSYQAYLVDFLICNWKLLALYLDYLYVWVGELLKVPIEPWDTQFCSVHIFPNYKFNLSQHFMEQCLNNAPHVFKFWRGFKAWL